MRNEIKDIKKAHVNLMNMKDHQIRELRQKVAWYEQVIEDIKRDIDIYRCDCLLSLAEQDEKCKQCTAVTFNSVRHIIDKNLKETDDIEEQNPTPGRKHFGSLYRLRKESED